MTPLVCTLTWEIQKTEEKGPQMSSDLLKPPSQTPICGTPTSVFCMFRVLVSASQLADPVADPFSGSCREILSPFQGANL